VRKSRGKKEFLEKIWGVVVFGGGMAQGLLTAELFYGVRAGT